MTKHTPGAWKAEKVSTAVGYAWCVAPIGACMYVDSRGGACNPEMQDDEAEANARLIAAAPDLYEALEALTAQQEGPIEGCDCAECEAVWRADAALRKARGEE